MAISFTVKTHIQATPEEIYSAWLDGNKHGKMIGAEATGKAEVGSEFTAWDGYISGRNLELVPNKKIVQAWRTIEFMDDDKDSHLEIHLSADKKGCKLTLIHTNIPENQPDYEQCWADNYFDPMKEYFQ